MCVEGRGAVRTHDPEVLQAVVVRDAVDMIENQRHVPAPPAWQFGVAYPLPKTVVNHAFTGWSGRSAVVWPKRHLSLTIAADTDYYVLYTPPGEDFFCFEPVDHPINAMNLAGGASENGMTLLARGERLTRTFRFTVERTGLRSMPGGRGARRKQ